MDYEPDEVTSNPPARRVMRHLGVVLVVGAVLATLFTAWTPASLSPGELAGQLISMLEGEPSTPGLSVSTSGGSDENDALRVGVIIGHLGLNPSTDSEDPGAVCADGFTELELNQAVGTRTARALEAAGLEVDILEEFDPRLFGYRAVALVSIHADACVPINDQATGYKVTAALDTVVPDRAQRLVDCLIDRYGRSTEMNFHKGSITRDMTEYHTFNEIHSQTPAAIIETGFLYLDRDFLMENPELAARGIAEGVLCYINNEPISIPGDEGP